MAADEPKRFHRQILVDRGRPIRFSEVDAPDDSGAPETPESSRLGKTLRAYREAALRLLSEKYPALKDLAPLHMRGECDCLALVCDDGIVVRWDRKAGEKPKVRVGRLEGEMNTVANVAPKLSDGLIYCADQPETLKIPSDAPRIQFAKTDAHGEVTPIADHQLALVISARALRDVPAARRPIPVVSVLNDLTVELHGTEVDVDAESDDPGQRFVARGPLRLPVGWEVFEVYPRVETTSWDADAAADWAEMDLLANAARRNVAELTLKNLDPRSVARREFATLLKQFEDLLNGPEAPVQSFLEAHPELLRPSYAHVWRRLPIGAHITDFVIREPSNEYVLVEIEAPVRSLFRNDGQPRAELTHAINQVSDWIEFIQQNLEAVRRDLGLTGISATPRGLVVIGRSSDMTEDNRSKLNTLRGMVPRLDILTYDDLLATTKSTLQNLLGTLPDPRTTAEVFYLPKS